MKKKTIDINEKNYSHIINESEELALNIKVSSTVYIEFNAGSSFDLKVTLEPGITAEIVYWNQNSDDMKIVEFYELASDSNLKITYGELAEIDVIRDVDAKLQHGSNLLIDSASITSSVKKQEFRAHHLSGNTRSDTNNYSIVIEGGEYYLDVIGEIDNGAQGAKAFQESRILTTSGKQKATVLPQLLIYENDVEASHAATVGQINMDHLYYMQTRGMSEMQAMALVMSSYLMPIARAIQDKEIADQVVNLIDKRVNEICFIPKQ